jgi:membrane protease YdiL (CAAX protease family)
MGDEGVLQTPAVSPMQMTGRRARAAVGTACLLMLMAALENTVAPWAPFYVVYAALALGLPFLLGKGEAGRFAMPSRRFWLAAIVLAFLLQLAFRLIVRAADLPGLFEAVFGVAGARLKQPPELVAKSYLLFIVAWAGAGEEVFYRGYLQTRLSARLGPVAGLVGASSLFAARHYTQVLLAWPHILWGSATIWVAATFIVGLGFGWLYQRSGSLVPPILCHYLFNILGFLG